MSGCETSPEEAIELRFHEMECEIAKLKEELDRWRKGYNTVTRAHYEAEIAKLKKESTNLFQIVQDDCDADTDWRTAAGEWDKSDSYGVESAATVIERMKEEITKLKQERDEAYERAAQVCDGRASWSSLHGFKKEYYEAEECAHEIRALKSEPTEGK